MLTPRRKGSTYHHGALYDAAIEAGTRQIEKGGLAALGVRKIANELHVTPAALYRHFESAEDLQAAISISVRRELGQYLQSERKKSTSKSPKILMRIIGDAYIDFARKNPRLFEVAFLHCDATNLDRADDPAWQVLMEGVNNFKGRLKPGTELVLWSVVHGFAMLVAQEALNQKESKHQQKLVLDGVGRLLN